MGWTAENLCCQADIIDVQHRYASGIDRRNWILFRSVFSDRVEIDFSDWHGGGLLELDADDWVSRVAARQSGFDATQHQMSNHSVVLAEAGAECTTYIVARHHLVVNGEHLMQAIGGYYTNELLLTDDAWKITKSTLKVLWTQGDRGLFDIAKARLDEGFS